MTLILKLTNKSRNIVFDVQITVHINVSRLLNYINNPSKQTSTHILKHNNYNISLEHIDKRTIITLNSGGSIKVKLQYDITNKLEEIAQMFEQSTHVLVDITSL